MIESMLRRWREQVWQELTGDIIPFWQKYSVDRVHGGFVGAMSNDLTIDSEAGKGLILNTRLLQAFSSFDRFLPHASCRAQADLAWQTLTGHFEDGCHGGGYWMVTADNRPLDPQKKIYGQAFFIYALVEYYRLTGNAAVLRKAQSLFRLIEEHAFDPECGGYYEVLNRDWTLAARQQLGEEDLDAPKSMNNHLHLLEAYAALYSVWKEPLLAQRLEGLIRLFQQEIVDPHTGHFRLFFTRDWIAHPGSVSFGHDIEGSWLLCDAAERLGHAALTEEVADLALRMARVALDEAVDEQGGLAYEAGRDGRLNGDRHFWCQAEAAVGFLNAFRLSGDESFLQAAGRIWQFIETFQIDRTHGEWYWKIDRHGNPDLSLPKISPWKCPYHNGRACIEIITRLDALMHQAAPCRSQAAPARQPSF